MAHLEQFVYSISYNIPKMDKQRKKAILHVKYTLKYNHNN